MAEPRRFDQIQRRFCAHIRDPENHPPPDGIEDRRMAVYRNLFFNNINGFLSSGFPVLRSLYEDKAWLALVRNFFASHYCKTPYFAEIPAEFLDFLGNEYEPTPDDPPFLLELAHYEWVELAISVLQTDDDDVAIDPQGDLLADRPVLSSAAWLLSYHWPVQHISADFRPTEPLKHPNHLIVWRDPEDEVGFIEANPITARLFQLLQQNDHASGQSILERIASELDHPNPAIVIDGGRQTLIRLHHLGIVRGTTRD